MIELELCVKYYQLKRNNLYYKAMIVLQGSCGTDYLMLGTYQDKVMNGHVTPMTALSMDFFILSGLILTNYVLSLKEICID